MDASELQIVAEMVKRGAEIASDVFLQTQRQILQLRSQVLAQETRIQELSSTICQRVDHHNAEMSTALSEQREAVEELNQEITQQGQSVANALKAAEDLRNTSSRLDNIAVESRLLSVNAKIEASHLGSASRSIQVIATTVRDLSNSLLDCSSGLDHTVAEVAQAVPLVASQTETTKTFSSKIGLSMQASYDRLLQTQTTLTEEMKSALNESKQQAQTSISASHDILATIQSYDEAVQLLNAALIRLGNGFENGAIGTPERYLANNPTLVSDETEDDIIFL